MSSLTTAAAAAVRLTNETLNDLPSTVRAPSYRRSSLTASVVHLGVGGFHRSHQAVYFDDLASLGTTDWGIVGVGISHRELAEVLTTQDHLFTVIERGPARNRARVIGTMVDFLLLAQDYDAVVDRLCNQQIRLVTLTVTGDAYQAYSESGPRPSQIFTALVDALERRHQLGLAPFTVLSCDNLPDSGEATRRAITYTAALRDTKLAEWIEQEVAFPSSMVDRITPGTSSSDRDQIEAEFSIADGWPVITEPFKQWVIEDWFCNDRPPLERVGARFVKDVRPYRLIKSRLLNGTHCAAGYLGTLAGHSRIDAVMRDPIFGSYVRRLTGDEIAPLLPDDLPGMELAPYREAIIHRLENPAVADPLGRLCRRGSVKMRDYLIPSIAQAIAEDRPRQLLTLALAGWLVYASDDRADWRGRPAAPIEDDRAPDLGGLARQVMAGSPLPLELNDIFGTLCGDAAFGADLAYWIQALRRRGVRMALSAALGGRR
jgi:mannitol 2-dehydrogenase